MSLEGRLAGIEGQLKAMNHHLANLNSRTSKAEGRLDKLEDRNVYRDGFADGRGAISAWDVAKIVGPIAALGGLGLTAVEVLG